MSVTTRLKTRVARLAVAGVAALGIGTGGAVAAGVVAPGIAHATGENCNGGGALDSTPQFCFTINGTGDYVNTLFVALQPGSYYPENGYIEVTGPSSQGLQTPQTLTTTFPLDSGGQATIAVDNVVAPGTYCAVVVEQHPIPLKNTTGQQVCDTVSS